jgi:hypothetical protein
MTVAIRLDAPERDCSGERGHKIIARCTRAKLPMACRAVVMRLLHFEGLDEEKHTQYDVWRSQEGLAQDLGCGRSTVIRALKRLQKEGMVQPVDRLPISGVVVWQVVDTTGDHRPVFHRLPQRWDSPTDASPRTRGCVTMKQGGVSPRYPKDKGEEEIEEPPPTPPPGEPDSGALASSAEGGGLSESLTAKPPSPDPHHGYQTALGVPENHLPADPPFASQVSPEQPLGTIESQVHNLEGGKEESLRVENQKTAESKVDPKPWMTEKPAVKDPEVTKGEEDKSEPASPLTALDALSALHKGSKGAFPDIESRYLSKRQDRALRDLLVAFPNLSQWTVLGEALTAGGLGQFRIPMDVPWLLYFGATLFVRAETWKAKQAPKPQCDPKQQQDERVWRERRLGRERAQRIAEATQVHPKLAGIDARCKAMIIARDCCPPPLEPG